MIEFGCNDAAHSDGPAANIFFFIDHIKMIALHDPVEINLPGKNLGQLDGNHRVSVARQHGFELIEAYVWEFPTPYGLSPEADMDELLAKSERIEFLERIGQASPPAVREIALTCFGCYGDLVDMIETYRQALEDVDEQPVSTEQAVLAWYEEVYGPAIDTIQEYNLLAQFPNRTDAHHYGSG